RPRRRGRSQGWRMILAGDVGGTKTALATLDETSATRRIVREATLASREIESFEDAVAAFVGGVPALRVRAACFGVAGPVVDGRARGGSPPLSAGGVRPRQLRARGLRARPPSPLPILTDACRTRRARLAASPAGKRGSERRHLRGRPRGKRSRVRGGARSFRLRLWQRGRQPRAQGRGHGRSGGGGRHRAPDPRAARRRPLRQGLPLQGALRGAPVGRARQGLPRSSGAALGRRASGGGGYPAMSGGAGVVRTQ